MHAPTAPSIPYLLIKRAVDIVLSFSACVLGAVPMLACMVAIRLESPGSPVFIQERLGEEGRPISIFKLRTMVEDAEENIEVYLDAEQLRQWADERKVDDDPRVTRIGRLLRTTSLDEFPQFLNVLIGQMSIVGPRPITEAELHWFGDDAEEFLSATPGITGWWQVNARNEAIFENGERQEMELYYVRTRSLVLDARLFLQTFATIVRKTGR